MLPIIDANFIHCYSQLHSAHVVEVLRILTIFHSERFEPRGIPNYVNVGLVQQSCTMLNAALSACVTCLDQTC